MNDLLFMQEYHSFQDLSDHSTCVLFAERLFGNSPEKLTSSSSVGGEEEGRRGGREGEGRRRGWGKEGEGRGRGGDGEERGRGRGLGQGGEGRGWEGEGSK